MGTLADRIGEASPGTPGMRFSPTAFIAFLALALAVNYPGRINEDSLGQLIGWSRPAFRNDLHSPFVTWIWSLADPLLGQPQSALLAQSAFLAFFAAVLPAQRPRNGAAWAAAAIELPFKLILVLLAGFIIKDVLLAGLLLSALAALGLAVSGNRARLWLVIGLFLLALALTVRPTNFLILWTAGLLILPLLGRPTFGGIAWVAGAAALLLAAAPAQMAANRWIFRAQGTRAETQLQVFDMAGISVRSGRDQFARLPGWPTASVPAPGQCYRQATWEDFAAWGKCSSHSKAMDRAAGELGRGGLAAWWLQGIAAHPGAYARHRIGYMASLIDSKNPALANETVPEGTVVPHRLPALNRAERAVDYRRSINGRIDPREIGQWRDNVASGALARLMGPLIRFRWTEALALASCFILIGRAWAQRRRGKPVDMLAPAAAAIAIGNALMYLPFGIASQARYLLPTLCCAIFALIAALRAAGANEKRAT